SDAGRPAAGGPPRDRSEPSKRRARACVGESEGRSPSFKTMSFRIVPGSALIVGLCTMCVVVLVALLAGAPIAATTWGAALGLMVLLVVTIGDYVLSREAWQQSSPTVTRTLPAALAIAVQRPVRLTIAIRDTGRSRRWQFELYDHADPTLHTEGLPVELTVSEGTAAEITYHVT